MKKSLFLLGACGAMFMAAQSANAQEAVVVEEQVVAVEEVPCHTHYYSTSRDNWFIQIGGGINSAFMENYLPGGDKKHHMTVAYNFAFGKWFSPYIGWRLSFLGGPLHWDNGEFSKAKYVNANLDFMWDMFNSHKVNSRRVFSIIPFVGLGGTFAWDFKAERNVVGKDGKPKSNSWTLPVSAGLQLRFRLSKYVDFFAEGRAQFYGDNFNNYAYGQPIDINITAIGGFIFNIGGSDFKSYNPCDYVGYINSLNNQVNDLRGELATTAAALAAAEAQLPCPEVQPQEVVSAAAPLLSTVRFRINSSKISNEEQVNVYNVAEWLKQNPQQSITITGYADKDTGSSAYNMGLSQRRAEAVKAMLTKDYGISADRITVKYEGSDVQPYSTNDWNRIAIFSNK
ncbi:MAG: OmpA family protein [Muribaculaceae bacterium]|nr:OmpA family protein [Muribaculaceae bacterium]